MKLPFNVKLPAKIALPGKAAPALREGVIVPVRGSFDLSGGAFSKAERTRRFLLGLSLVTAAVLTAMLLFGIRDARSASTASEQAAAADLDKAAALKSLAAIDQAEGHPAEDLRTHIKPRQATLAKALASDADIPPMIQALTAAAPPGLVVSGISITWEAPKVAAGATTTAARPGATTAPSPSAPAVDTNVQTVKIIATGEFTSIQEMQSRLAQIPGFDLSKEDPKWTGSGSQTTVTFMGTLTPEATSARAKALKAADNYGQSRTTPAKGPQDTAANPVNTVVSPPPAALGPSMEGQ